MSVSLLSEKKKSFQFWLCNKKAVASVRDQSYVSLLPLQQKELEGITIP